MGESAPRWAVALEGQDEDLAQLAAHVDGTTRVTLGPDGWELAADDLEPMADGATVYKAALPLVRALDALARWRLRSLHAIRAGVVYQHRADGSRKQWVVGTAGLATAAAQVFGVGAVIGPDGAVPEPPTPESWVAIVELAGRDGQVRAAVDFLSLEPTWHSLYAALDVPRHDGRTKAYKGVLKRLSKQPSPQDEVRRFSGTAGSYQLHGTAARHGDSARPAPECPMSLEEARSFVYGIVDAWIEQLIRQGH